MHYERNDLNTAREIIAAHYRVDITVSELNSLREALVHGFGWSFLPAYSVQRELREGTLKVIPGFNIEPMYFGVWWNKNSKPEATLLEFCVQWLKGQRL